jgi:hypothetical protein
VALAQCASHPSEAAPSVLGWGAGLGPPDRADRARRRAGVQWRRLLWDNHAAYSSWEDFRHPQQLLEANRPRPQGGAGGAAKRGPALRSGL